MAHEILIVDDEADIRAQIAGVLSDEGYDTRSASDSDGTLAAIEARLPSMVLLDIWLQGSKRDGIELLKMIQESHPGLPVIMISGHGNIETAVQAIRLGAYDFIEKPFEADRLLLVIDRSLETYRLKRENQELRQRAGGNVELIGESPGISAVRQAIDRVAPTGSRVLITGPAGVGKEVVARLLHARSRRGRGPFVVLNCAAKRPEHLETDLFGIEARFQAKDSPRKTGTFEAAHGGTLLLDEVADMPLETQGKIVRVLQEQTFERVGGNTKVEVDVRVVAATNRELAAEIEAGRFREDLFYRLNVVPIRVPPLRERREDIPLLAKHFMGQAARSSGLVEREIGDDAMAALQIHQWPGNVRQLRNLIEWLLIMAPGEIHTPIRADVLPPEIVAVSPAVLQWEKGGGFMGLSLREAREVFEREYLSAQIMRFGGNISRTASFIGMERSALHRKLKILGITNTERLQA